MILVKTMAPIVVIYLMLSFSLTALAMSEEGKTEFMKMSEEERAVLLMYFDEDELFVVSATRSLKSISHVAENVEVVTAAEIELMNAHTLADVLNTVNGVVVQFGGGSPTVIAGPSIQGSSFEHVVVMLDGVAINTAGDFGDLSLIPAQIIDKVEVIKGPASSAWGSSLGGVVNVITKSPRDSTRMGGTVSASYGERGTMDLRAELTGNKAGLGYYLYAGRVETDGLRPAEDAATDYLFLKLSYDLTERTRLSFSGFYNWFKRELGDFHAWDLFLKDKEENYLATLDLKTRLSEGLDLNLSLRAERLWLYYTTEDLSIDDRSVALEDFRKYGATAKLNWRTGMHNIVFGSDYDYKEVFGDNYPDPPKLNIFAVYVNDTITLNKLSITPGLRYDYTDRDADFWSPSLGITYELGDKTILRASVARGFHLPVLGATDTDGEWYRHNPDLKPETVWSYQAGIESGVLKYVWVKANVFRHEIRDAMVDKDIDVDAGTWTTVNEDRVRRQGFELALRSMKFYNFTFSAAAMFVDAEDLDTGRDIREWPAYTYDAEIKYDDEKSLRALVHGRYVWWDLPISNNAKYSSFIVDANIIKTIFRKEDRSLDVFLTAHNIFNGSQYWNDLYKNSGRWFEAGLRYKF